MIENIYILKDSPKGFDDLLNKLNQLTKIEKIRFVGCTKFEISNLKANEVLFIVDDQNSENLESFKREFTDKTISYLTSKPSSSVISDFESCNYIGIQRHLSPLIAGISDTILTLGDLKNGIHKTEPYLRESHAILFDFNVLRKSEVLNNDFAPPSGLFSEEISQMFRYAGMSEINRCVYIKNGLEDFEELILQFIWYYAEAASTRFPDHPYFSNSVNEYVVNMKSIDKSISFFKSKISGRWWVKIPGIERNKWQACSYEDYKEACNDEISNELLYIIAE